MAFSTQYEHNKPRLNIIVIYYYDDDDDACIRRGFWESNSGDRLVQQEF